MHYRGTLSLFCPSPVAQEIFVVVVIVACEKIDCENKEWTKINKKVNICILKKKKHFLVRFILTKDYFLDPNISCQRRVYPHPMLLLSEVHAELCRSCSEDCPTQKWRRDELDGMRYHLLFLLLWCLSYFCNKLHPEHSFLLL